MKVLLVIAALAVGIGVAAMLFGSADDGNGLYDPSPAPRSTPAPLPRAYDGGSGLDKLEPATSSDSLKSITVSGPHLVASDALGDPADLSNQQRVFRSPDGTIAILYHRPGGPKRELQEIVLVHSHDGGSTWDGELSIGLEAQEATYSGVMDADGNLYVAYGRQAVGRLAGAVKLRTIYLRAELHGWVPGPEHRVVQDWPGEGASRPTLALTGSRLWLAYRHYAGGGYTLSVTYADPNPEGDYPTSQWSSPIDLTRPNGSLVHATLVSHGAQLSALFVASGAGVQRRVLHDPRGDPEAWGEPETVMGAPGPERGIRFSAVADSNGNLHLAVEVEGLYIAFLTHDGSGWSRPRQLASNGVFKPSITTDGQDIWAFWQRQLEYGQSQIKARRWVVGRGWERVATRPWLEKYGVASPSLVVYRERGRGYTDVTRYATNQTAAGGAPGPSIAAFLEGRGDILYLGRAEKFDHMPLSLDRVDSVDTVDADGPLPPFEFWNGSQWMPLPISDEPSQPFDGTSARNRRISFLPPEDWDRTDVNGVEGYYLRLRRDSVSKSSLAAVKLVSQIQLSGPLTAVAHDRVIDTLWSVHPPGSDQGRLWYGGFSSDAIGVKYEVPRHTHESEPISEATAQLRKSKPLPLPPGSPRQYISQELNQGETYEYQLLDGQVRFVTVIGTSLVSRSPEGVTLWATATIEVSGPGLEPKREEIPAAYFQAPVVLNGVRIYVEITKEFNDFRLLDGGGTRKAARLMLSDARYSLTDLSQYRWPFPGMMWGIGAQNYYQGLRGSVGSHAHVGAFEQSMMPGTPVGAWHQGKFALSRRQGAWAVSLANAEDGLSSDWHRASPVADADQEKIGAAVELGDTIGETNRSAVRWGSGTDYDWTLVLAEWYVGQSTAVERSYVKDWLVLGPYDAQSGEGSSEPVSPLRRGYLPDEPAVAPQAGDPAPGGLTWKRFDGIVPGVIDVAEALSEFTNSGWALINGNYADTVAYLATYVYTPVDRLVTLNFGSSDGVRVWLGDDLVLDKDVYVRVNQSDDWSIWPDFYQEPVFLRRGWTRVLLKLSQRRTNFSGVQSAQRSWLVTFRVSDWTGAPTPRLVISPEKDRLADPLRYYAITSADPSRVNPARPPIGRHNWPEKVDLDVGESYTYVLRNGETRTLRLLSYDVVIPRHKVEATVEVGGGGRTETHTLHVALDGVPVSINGLRVYAYIWKEANVFGFEQVGTSGAFPLALGKDVGFALSDPSAAMYPDMGSYTYPFDIAFNEGRAFQSFLEPSGSFDPNAPAHAGYDANTPPDANLVALHDGTVWISGPNLTDPRSLGHGSVTISTTSGDQYNDPASWIITHVLVETATVPSGTFVTKGTPLAKSGSHVGSKNSFDFGSWLFMAQIWNQEHKDDFPAPRYWLVLGPYGQETTDDHIYSDEGGDIPATILPQRGALDRNKASQWKLADNFVNSIVQLGELLSESPFSGYTDRKPVHAVAYAATYVYSPEDHSGDDKVWLKWGASDGAKIWLNGRTVFDDTEKPEARRLVVDETDIPLPLTRGWNTLIIKHVRGSATPRLWRFSSKIGDSEGNRIPELKFSTRAINLRAIRVGERTIDLSWSDPTFHGTHVETYKVDVATDAGFTNLLVDDLDVGKVTSYTLTGLGGEQGYFIRVKPYNYSELGGTVYWRLFDSDSLSAAPAGLVLRSPAQGETIVGDSVTVAYSVFGDLELADRVMLRLDDNPDKEYLTLDGDHVLTGLSPGAHTLQGWLVDLTGSLIDGAYLAVSFVTETPLQPGDPRKNGWLRVEGNRIVDESGTPIMLRGANIENWQWIWAETEDKTSVIEFERRAIPELTGSPPDGWGANIIHLDVAAKPIIDEDPEYLGALDEMVSLAKSNGAYTLLSMRFLDLMDEPSSPNQVSEGGVARLAARYRDEPAVIYVVGSEPRDITWEELKPRLTSMVDAIRVFNPRALIAVPGTEWSRYVYRNLTDPIERDNIMLHVSAFDTWDIIQFGGGGYLLPYRLDEVAAVYPVILGGFGLRSSPVPGQQFWMTEIGDLRSLLDFAEERGISWTGWVFNSAGCPCMLSDAETFDTTPYGEEIRARLMAASSGPG